MKTTRFKGPLLAAAACLALAACGGGGGGRDDDAPPPGGPDAPPESASMSDQGFLAFIASFAGRRFDRSEPYDLSMFDAPAGDDTGTPIATPVDR